MNEKQHIGKLIKTELKNQGRSITWLSAQIGYSRVNIYKILQKEWIYTDLLLKISIVLQYDFFKHYSDYLNSKIFCDVEK